MCTYFEMIITYDMNLELLLSQKPIQKSKSCLLIHVCAALQYLPAGKVAFFNLSIHYTQTLH